MYIRQALLQGSEQSHFHAAERNLHATLNDTIVLISRKRGQQHLARFVDRTAQDDSPGGGHPLRRCTPARIWGRQSFYAVDISRADAPFYDPRER